MNNKINGKLVSDILYDELYDYLSKKNKEINVVDISIGNDFGGLMYSKMKQKKISAKTGINFESKHFENISKEELEKYIEYLNKSNVTGIMLQLPLPYPLNNYEREILDLITPEKDIDGLTSASAGKLITGAGTLIPCTPHGIEVLLKTYNIDLEGQNVAIISRSNIVGKPMALLMLQNNATPIICHSKTKNLYKITRTSDIVIAALNKQEFITEKYIKEGAVVIDVGVHKNKEGKTVGDVAFDEVSKKASLITPPTGAVGPMTICMLAYNAAKSAYGREIDEILESGITKAKKKILS